MLTPDQVGDRLKEAARTLKRLPPGEWRHLHSLRSAWPAMNLSRWDHAGEASGERAEVRVTRAPRLRPSPEAIDRAEEAVGWLLWLRPADRGVIFAWALGVPMYYMRRKFGFSRWTVRRRVAKALGDIAVRLTKEERK